jgi:hypothetical protein
MPRVHISTHRPRASDPAMRTRDPLRELAVDFALVPEPALAVPAYRGHEGRAGSDGQRKRHPGSGRRAGSSFPGRWRNLAMREH